MLKNAMRFVETFKNYASYIHTFSLTDNCQNSRKKGKKRGKNLPLEAIFRRCSIKKVFLKSRKTHRKTPLPDRSSPWRIPMPKCYFLSEPCNFIKTETLEQVFICDFCEIFDNNFF